MTKSILSLDIEKQYLHKVSFENTTATGNFLISRARFMEYVSASKKWSFSFSFSKLRYGAFGFNPKKFRQHMAN